MRINVNQENNAIKGFEGEFLHPALDIKRNVLVLGFRCLGKKREEKEIFLIAKKGNLEVSAEDSFEFNDKEYFLEKRGRKLIRIEERWSLQKLNKFLEGYYKGEPVLPKPKDVYQKNKELSKKYMELEKDIDYSLITIWAIGTYFFPIFSAYPFLNIKAPKRSGKSQCLNFLKQICFNATKARATLAALSDTVDSLRGVYLIDQADSLKRKGNEELLDILADSYKKGGGKRRIIDFGKGKERKVLELETYSPKAFASIGELPEDLGDRCFIIPLIRSQRNFLEPDEESEDWKEIRGMLYKLLIENYTIVESTYNVQKTKYRIEPKITGRELELWLPLEIMFELCSPDETQEAQRRFQQLYGYTEYQPQELEKEIIKTVYWLFPDNESQITLRPEEIGEEIKEEAWQEMLNPHQKVIKIGFAIKKFNLSTEKKNTNKGVSYLFDKEKVSRIKSLYCSPA